MLLRCESLEPLMSQLGHERRFRYLRGTSAYPSRLAVKVDIPDRQVRARKAVQQENASIQSPRRRGRAVWADYRGQAPWRS